MGSSKLIFVVDDDPFINTLIVKRFTADGYRVEAFESGEECLKAMNKNPELIILDYLFTKEGEEQMNGLEIFGKIREVKKSMPVIMLSGQDNGELVLELARKGIDDYVIKDNSLISNLAVSIKELLESKS